MSSGSPSEPPLTFLQPIHISSLPTPKNQDGNTVHKQMADVMATASTSSVQSVLQSCDFNHCAISPVVRHIQQMLYKLSSAFKPNENCSHSQITLAQPAAQHRISPSAYLSTQAVALCVSNEIYGKTNNLSYRMPDQ